MVQGFKTENGPPVIKELVKFEEELYKMEKFRKICNNEFQFMINKAVKSSKSSKEIIVHADKSPNLYKVPIRKYTNIRHSAVTKDYKLSNQTEMSKVNLDTLELVRTHESGLENRVKYFHMVSTL